MKKLLFLWLFFAVLFAACTDDDDNGGEIPMPEVNKVKMIVVNEGLFNTGTADISVVYEDGTTIWNAFERANGVPMGPKGATRKVPIDPEYLLPKTAED